MEPSCDKRYVAQATRSCTGLHLRRFVSYSFLSSFNKLKTAHEIKSFFPNLFLKPLLSIQYQPVSSAKVVAILFPVDLFSMHIENVIN